MPCFGANKGAARLPESSTITHGQAISENLEVVMQLHKKIAEVKCRAHKSDVFLQRDICHIHIQKMRTE